MSLFSSRAEQLADHLQTRILKNEWSDPLPSRSEWARQLAVGRKNLGAALEILQKRGLLEVDKRCGVRLARKAKNRTSVPRRHFVRILYHGADYPLDTTFIYWAGPLSAVLQKRGGQLSFEKQSDRHWRELCEGGLEPSANSGDLLLPLGVAAKYQRMLSLSGLPCIHIGTPMEGGTLPFIVCDLSGTIRHATHALIRRGFNKLTFILTKADCPGTLAMQETFLAACREWAGHTIEARTLLVRMQDKAERAALNRFASRISTPHGILTMPPVPTDLIATALMARHIRLPAQVDIIVAASFVSAVRVHPPVSHYPFPMEVFVKTLANAIFDFWETGEPPVIQKVLPMKMVSPLKN